MTTSVRTLISTVMLGAIVLGCGTSGAPSVASVAPSVAPPSAPPSEAASASPGPAASEGVIKLERTGPVGCDSIGVDYTAVTINIDVSSEPDVWAGTDTAKKIAVKWTNGFTTTDQPEPTILGPKGEEVARDGTVINVPAGAYPRLAGYFVCLAPETIYVLETDPQ